MGASDKAKVLEALDALGGALTDYDHVWSAELRALYERAVDICRGEQSKTPPV